MTSAKKSGGRLRAVICSQSNFATDYRIEKMRQTLTDCGFDVSLLGRAHPREERVGGAAVHYMRLLFWRGPLFYAELNLRLAMRLLAGGADLIVSIDLDTLAGCMIASRLRSSRLMFDSHELFPEVPEIAGKPLVKKVWQAVQDFCVPRLRPTDVAVTVCQSIADIFYHRYGRRFLVVRNAPLAGRALPSAEGGPSARPFTILYQGAVNVGRGVEEIIGALPSLPLCHFTVVGDGDVLPGAKALARALGVEDRVSFVGRVPFERLAPFMAGADIGVVIMKDLSLNQRYALPNRLFDFIQAELPIIANRLPEMEKIVDGEDVGMCVDEVSAESVAKAIESVMSRPDDVARWRRNMRMLAPRLTWQNEVSRVQECAGGSLVTLLKENFE